MEVIGFLISFSPVSSNDELAISLAIFLKDISKKWTSWTQSYSVPRGQLTPLNMLPWTQWKVLNGWQRVCPWLLLCKLSGHTVTTDLCKQCCPSCSVYSVLWTSERLAVESLLPDGTAYNPTVGSDEGHSFEKDIVQLNPWKGALHLESSAPVSRSF